MVHSFLKQNQKELKCNSLSNINNIQFVMLKIFCLGIRVETMKRRLQTATFSFNKKLICLSDRRRKRNQ